MTTESIFKTDEDKKLFVRLFTEQLEKQRMSNYHEPKKRESYYMGDEDDWRVLWPKAPIHLDGYDSFKEVFGKVPKEPAQPKPLPARASQVGGHHYKDKAMQPWDIIDAWELNFYAGNVVKYILRYKHKDGLQDLQKARHYIDKLIEDYADPT